MRAGDSVACGPSRFCDSVYLPAHTIERREKRVNIRV
jgi:hypothetical protein